MIWQYLEYSSELVWRPETCDTTRWRSDRHVYQLKQLLRQRKFDNFDLFLLFAMRVTVGWDNRLRRSIYSTQTGDAVDLPGAWDDYILQFYKSCWFSGLVIPHVPLAGRGPQTLSSVSCEEPTQQSSNWPKFLTLSDQQQPIYVHPKKTSSPIHCCSRHFFAVVLWAARDMFYQHPIHLYFLSGPWFVGGSRLLSNH